MKPEDFLRYEYSVTHNKSLVDRNGHSLDGASAQGYVADTENNLPEMMTVSLGSCWNIKEFKNNDTAVLTDINQNCFAIKNAIFLDAINLLANGPKKVSQIQEHLARKGYSFINIRTMLYQLYFKKIIISADYNLSQKQASFWDCQGIAPILAEKRLNQMPLFLKSLTDIKISQRFIETMKDSGGWKFTDRTGPSSLSIYLVDSFLQEEIKDLNEYHLNQGTNWLLIQTKGARISMGPVFGPLKQFELYKEDQNRPCWNCLGSRLKNSLGYSHRELSPINFSHTQLVQDIAWAQLATQLNSFLIYPLHAPISGHFITSIPPYEDREYHWVHQRPQCAVCGDHKLQNSQRKPRPLELFAHDNSIFTSGGRRTFTARETFERYRKFVSPLTGVVNTIRTCTNEFQGKDFVSISHSGTNQATSQQGFKGFKKNFRYTSGGKGLTLVESQASGLCESLERYSGVFQGEEEIFRKAKFTDFKENEAIAPNDIMLFSERQYQQRQSINQRENSFYQVPTPFDPTHTKKWTPVWSLTQKRFKYVLLEQCYYYEDVKLEDNPDHIYALADSNGCAGGTTLEDAIIQGTYELIERDAVAIFWYNRFRCPEVDIKSFDNPYINKMLEFYEQKMQRDLWVLDVTSDLGVPCFAALSQNKSGHPYVFLGLGAQADPEIALLRAINEMNQLTFGHFHLLSDFKLEDIRDNFDEITAEWIIKADRHKSEFSWITPKTGSKRTYQDYSPPHFANALEEIDFLKTILESKGLEMLVLDQTRPDINFPAAKVFSPGLRHFWCRLAPGRLYDVPVEQGLFKEKKRESQMNPMPFFF